MFDAKIGSKTEGAPKMWVAGKTSWATGTAWRTSSLALGALPASLSPATETAGRHASPSSQGVGVDAATSEPESEGTPPLGESADQILVSTSGSYVTKVWV